MSFTEKKFACLSKLNRYKKTAYIIREYLKGVKTGNSPEEILQWFNKYENENNPTPQNTKQWGILTEKLIQSIEELSPYCEVNSFDKTDSKNKLSDFSVMLDNIRSPYNSGSIIRTAEALGYNEVILSGITPGLENSKAKRTAMNADIPIIKTSEPEELIEKYRKNGYKILAVEKTNCSEEISLHNYNTKSLIILGNEEFGISEEILKLSDKVIHIELPGNKNSLNVSVAAGIVLYKIMEKDYD